MTTLGSFRVHRATTRLTTGLLCCLVASSPAIAQSVASAPDSATIFIAKQFHTMERAAPTAQAVAVVGKRIVGVGSLADVRRSLGARAYRVDSTFREKTVLPGFIDQHLHPILGALTMTTEIIAPEDWVLPTRTYTAARTPAEYRARLRAAHVAFTDTTRWLTAWGYHALWHGPISRAFLDSISTTRPILIWQRSVHEFYLNTAAINTLGLTDSSMRGHGRASEMYDWAQGHWWESGTNLIMAPALKVLAAPFRVTAGLKQMIAMLHARGVTAFNEPGIIVTPEMWKLYQFMLGAADTPFYSYFFPDARQQVDNGIPVERAIADAERQVAMAPEGKVSFFPKTIKLFADGAIVSQLMQMKDGYLDGHSGEWMMTPAALEERARLYWNADYQLHIHVTGDGGLDLVLGVLEKLQREHPRTDHRTVIVHFANSTEAQVKRIKTVGAIVSANPYYPVGFADEYTKVGLGGARADVMSRAKSVLDAGIPLSFHSDLPIAPSDPLFLAWSAVNRVTASGRVAAPEQRISVMDAMRGITIEAAYSWRKEADLGSIAVGKIANFTVLDRDPFVVDPITLKDIPVWGTVFEGRVFPVPVRR